MKKFLNESNRIVNIRNDSKDSKVTVIKSVLHSSSGKTKQINMTNTLKVTEFSATVRGYHYYGSIWFPEKKEQLDCSHDFGNVFYVFAISCKPDDTVVGHLPREISRAAKFLLDRGAQISAILTSTDYRRSPLVPGGLEIACKVIVKLPGTVRNHLLMDRYVEIVKVNYIAPKHEVILGSFLKKLSTAAQPINKKRNTLNTNNPKKKQKPNHDIRSLFRRAEERRNEEQTTGVNNKSDKQYHEVINID